MKSKSDLHVCFVVGGYPTPNDPFMPFIKNTVAEMAKQGVKCTVIAPQSITRAVMHKVPMRPEIWFDKIDESVSIEVLQPKFISLSLKGRIINRWLFLIAAKRAYRKMDEKPDMLYGHFWHMGVAASKIDSSKPLFVACGESKISVCNSYAKEDITKMQKQLSGVIYVSRKSYEESVKLGLQLDNPYIIAPNGYDASLFNKKPKQECRKILNWPEDAFAVAFVGAFIERKGALRLSDALSKINETRTVYSCFIGSGIEQPTCPNILFAGKVDHKKIATYLNASDVFVLPTTNEGCCNAIIEAMACGLPIISSNGSFNDDILNVGNSIRVDPMNEAEIKEAIETLYNKPELKNAMGDASMCMAEHLTISSRIQKIIDFFRKNIR